MTRKNQTGIKQIESVNPRRRKKKELMERLGIKTGKSFNKIQAKARARLKANLKERGLTEVR